MNATTPTAAASTCWARTLSASVRQVLDRLDTTVSLTEAKNELARELIAKRRAWELHCQSIDRCGAQA